MKPWLSLFIVAASLATTAQAATINWSAGINHGFSLEDGSELPTGSLVRLGWFRDPVSGTQLSDTQIQALKTTPVVLDSKFVEAGRSTIGSGFSPALLGHFSAATSLDTGNSGANLVGKQMYIWVLNASTVGAATQQAILYWNIGDTSTNPDGTSDTPGVRWRFPAQESFPGTTTIDVTDLTIGTGSLAAGARLVVGTYPKGTSTASGKANFGLADLYQNPEVNTSRVLAGGSVGASYLQALSVIEGTPTYSWEIIGGALPDGLSMDTSGVISGRPTFAGSYTFVARARDQVPNSVSKEFSITVASTPLVITSDAALPDGGQDALYALNLTAKGGSAPYAWSLISGALPDGITLNSSGLLSGTPTAGGTASFVVKCTDSGALETTQSFTLAVQSLAIVTGSTLNNGFLNVPYSVALVATGGKPSYTWTLNAGALPPGLPPGVLLSPAGVLSFTPSAEGTSTFTLQVQDAAGSTRTQAFTLTVLRTLIAPGVNPPTFPTAIVGGLFSYKISGVNNPTKFSASGLPPGLSLNTTTGVISGRPTLAGVFTVQLKANNNAGTGPITFARLEVQALPSGVIGSYMGSIAHGRTLNDNLGGRLDLTTTKLGDYTLKLTQGPKVTTKTGKLDVSTTRNPTLNLTYANIVVALTLDASSNALTGTITDTNVGGSSASVAGWRRVWNATTNPASSLYGYYSFGIDPTTPVGLKPVPQGTGFASSMVYIDGGMDVVGKTADGNTILTNGFVGPNGELLVYQLLYSNLGSIVGRLTLTPDRGQVFTENTITGSLTWVKPPSATRIYPLGFGPMTMVVYGKYLAHHYKNWTVLGLPSSLSTASLNFNGGGIENASINPDVAAFVYTNAGKVVMPTAGTIDNPAKATLSIPFYSGTQTNNRNGQISGGFSLVDGPLKRDVTYQGMIIRTPNNSTKAFGYFLLPQIPVGTEKSTTSPILSGQVTISQ